MRISEAQLRRMVRQTINEMPLKNIDPMRRFSTESLYEPEDAEKQYAAVDKTYKSPNFAKKLKNFLSSWSTNFYVAPMYGSVFGAGARVEILPFKYFSDKYADDPGVAEALSSYEQIANPKNDCLILPLSTSTRYGNELTPWMIFHAMFDDENRETQEIFPTAWEIRAHLKENIDDLQYAFVAIARRENSGLEATKNIYKNFYSLLEEFFTFGSARSKYFTKRSTIDFNVDFRDAYNEAAVQSLLKDGFRYNPEALEKLAKLAPGLDVEDWKLKFNRIAAMSSQAKAEADSVLKGKVVIVDVA